MTVESPVPDMSFLRLEGFGGFELWIEPLICRITVTQQGRSLVSFRTDHEELTLFVERATAAFQADGR